MIHTIPGLEIEALDVGYAVRFVGDEKRTYWAPGAPTPLLMLSMRLSMLGLTCSPTLDLKMQVGAIEGAGESTSVAAQNIGTGPAPVTPPAADVIIEGIDAKLADVTTAPALLRELFGERSFTSTTLADATGILAARCSSLLSRLAASGAIVRGERRKEGIQYTVASESAAPVAPVEIVTPPGDYSEPPVVAPGSSAPTPDGADATGAVELDEPNVPEIEVKSEPTDVEFVRAVSEQDEPAREPAPAVDAVVASLHNQANVCLAAGWSRDKAIASMTSISAGTVPADVIEDIASSVFGSGAEPKAPF